MSFKTKLAKAACGSAVKLATQKISMATGLTLSRPTGVFVAITNRCNLRCKQCDVPFLAGRTKELSTEQWKHILARLNEWLGTAVLRWSGGEPFLRSDMLELIKYSSNLGMLNSVITNGQLIDKELAEQIVDAETFNVSLSIDGMQKGHDFVRGDGTFEKVADAARFLKHVRREKKSDMRIIVKTTIMETNLDELPELVEWVRRHGLNGISISPLMENLATDSPDAKWFEKSPLWVKDLQKLDRVVDWLIQNAGPKSPILNPKAYLAGIKEYFRDPTVPKPPDFTCHVGHDHFRIDPNGDVYLCPLITSALVGNVAQNSPEMVWKSPEARKSRNEILTCRKNCLVACQYERSFAENFDFFLKLFE